MARTRKTSTKAETEAAINLVDAIADTLEFTRREEALCGGTWVRGRTAGYRFEALVFAEHAENADYELAGSRISKLWIQRRDDAKVTFSWDRGADIAAADATTQAIVDFLVAGLADHIYGY